ncbi:hypothetical protein GN956_G17871 [Arapaima gigas]
MLSIQSLQSLLSILSILSLQSLLSILSIQSLQSIQSLPSIFHPSSAQVTVCSRRRRNRESPAGQTGSHRSPPTGLRRTAFLRPLLIRRLKCRRGCGRL